MSAYSAENGTAPAVLFSANNLAYSNHQLTVKNLGKQGQDAGGHGLLNGAGLIPLFPEATDAVMELYTKDNLQRPVLIAAGGIIEGRGLAAAIMLGASGVILGTRYLAAPEANIAQGYRQAVLQATDGGVNTDR